MGGRISDSRPVVNGVSQALPISPALSIMYPNMRRIVLMEFKRQLSAVTHDLLWLGIVN